MVNSGGTPSSGTGPSGAYEGINYVYTEASKGNFPYKRAGIISQCLNLSQYSNPVLHFWYHMYDGNSNNGINQGSFAVDVSTDNGTTWINDIWIKNGDQGRYLKFRDLTSQRVSLAPAGAGGGPTRRPLWEGANRSR